MLPLNSLIATEDYPLSRRLFFYLPPCNPTPWARRWWRLPKQPGPGDCRGQRVYRQTVQAMTVTHGRDARGYQASAATPSA
jgi:phosphate transport system substrate-binding protein